MAQPLDDKRIAFLTANEGVEQIELTSPWAAVTQAGGQALHVAPEAGAVQAFNHLDPADCFEATMASADVDATQFDALMLPGGVANPDQLRVDEASTRLIREFVEHGKPVGVICHGSWSMIDAGVVDGRTLTSWPSLETDLRNAGASWVDSEVTVCDDGPNVIVSSRKPDDLDAFNREFVAAVAGRSNGAAQ
jgi:protease I